MAMTIREEQYLAKIAGEDVAVPTPLTREEALLDKIAKNGGGGGGSDLPEVTSADEGKVLAVNASGEWAAENRSKHYIDTAGTLNCTFNQLKADVENGYVPYISNESTNLVYGGLNTLDTAADYEAFFNVAEGTQACYFAENADDPLVLAD